MRRCLADTTILTAYLYQRPPVLNLLNPWLTRKEVCPSILVYGEMVEYIRGRAGFVQHRDELRDLLKEVIPYDDFYRSQMNEGRANVLVTRRSHCL